jgi:serine/threonine protein kinase
MEYESPDSAPPEWQVGDVILNRYEVRQKFEGGGMGLVYRVYHREWKIDLAMKAPRSSFFQTQAQIEDFEREAETWVNLDPHQHIVSCHYVRRVNGVPHLFAEFVNGGTLEDWIKDGRLYQGNDKERTLRVLDIAIQIALALNHAHKRGIIHQDVKPANILMMPDGTAKLTDFGLARARSKLANTNSTFSTITGRTVWVEGAGLLTPEYASPEQFRGDKISSQSDGWSWALTVLEMMQGGRGWIDGRTGGAALEEHYGRSVDTDPIAKVLKKYLSYGILERPPDLEHGISTLAVCEKVTGRAFPRNELEPLSISRDLLNNRALSLLEIGREKEALAVLDSLISAHSLSSGSYFYEAHYNKSVFIWKNKITTDGELLQIWKNKLTAAELRKTSKNELLTENELYSGIYSTSADWCFYSGLRCIELGLHKEGKILLELAIRHESLAHDDRSTAANIIQSIEYSKSRTLGAMLPIDWMVSAIAFSKDGSKFVTCRIPHTQGLQEIVKLWDYLQGENIVSFNVHSDRIQSVAISNNMRFIVTGSRDKTAVILDLENLMKPVVLHGHTHAINTVAFSTNSSYIITAGDDKTVRCWKTEAGECVKIFADHDGPVLSAAMTSKDSVLVSATTNRIYFWDAKTGECLKAIHNGAKHLAITPDDKYLLSATDQNLAFFDLATAELLQSIPLSMGSCNAIGISDDGAWAISACDQLQLWKLSDATCFRQLEVAAYGVSYAGDNKWAFWSFGYYQTWLPLEMNAIKSLLPNPLPARPSKSLVPYLYCFPRTGGLFDLSPTFSLQDLENERSRRRRGRF